MSSGVDPHVAHQPRKYDNDGSTRRRGKRYISKACRACRAAKTKCDARKPRCSHCEQRNIECDCSWEQKPRGPAPDPLSARSARLRRLNAQHVPLHHAPRHLLESETFATLSPPSTPPPAFHPKSKVKRAANAHPASRNSFTLENNADTKDRSTGGPETVITRTSPADSDPLLPSDIDGLALSQRSYSSDYPREEQNRAHPESAEWTQRLSSSPARLVSRGYHSNVPAGDSPSHSVVPRQSVSTIPAHQSLFSASGITTDTGERMKTPLRDSIVSETRVQVDASIPDYMLTPVPAPSTSDPPCSTAPTTTACYDLRYSPSPILATGSDSRDEYSQALATHGDPRLSHAIQPPSFVPDFRIATSNLEDSACPAATSADPVAASTIKGKSIAVDPGFVNQSQSTRSWDTGSGFPATINVSPWDGFNRDGAFSQFYGNTHIPSLSIGELRYALPRQLTLFDDLPPLPSAEIMNKIVFKAFEDMQSGDNLFSLSVIHRPTFFARMRSGTVDPLLLLCVLCLGCRKHPARDIIRPSFSKRAARYLKWAIETAKHGGAVRFSTFQALMLWSTFVMSHIGRATSGQSWFTFTLSIAEAMNLDVEVAPSVQMNWIEREERRRGWWWCWCFDSLIALVSRSQPRLSDVQPALLLPCAETYFSLDPAPLVGPVNTPSYLVQADPPLFLDVGAKLASTKDQVWLLYAGIAKQSRTVLRLAAALSLSGANEPLSKKMEFKTHTEVSARLLNIFPPAVHLLASNEPFPGAVVYQGWFDGRLVLPSSVSYPIAVMAIMAYSSWLIPMGPRTKNMLEDTAWVGSETFLPCIELANACTRLIERLLSAVPTFPIPGTVVLFHIFQIGVIHLVCVKHALAKAPITMRSTLSPRVTGSDGTVGQGVSLVDVINSIETRQWTSDPPLSKIVMESLAKADVHGRVLRIHATGTKAGEGLWNLWTATLKDTIPMTNVLGSLELAERVVEVNSEEYQD